MTPIEQWNAMSVRERDAWIGEHVMGWTKERTEENVWFEPISRLWKPLDHITKLPSYYTNISAVMEAEEKIMQMGEAMRSKYVLNLLYVVKVENRSPFSGDELFALIHASAADRCAAMYLTLNQRR